MNPSRRNRNIGTAKQGFKTQSTFNIPSSWTDSRAFYEKLGQTIKITRMIGDQTILFIVEKTKKDSRHACTVEDIERILSHIPAAYYEGLTTFILRQPKTKEEIFSAVWGRLVYFYDLENTTAPAVLLESVNSSKSLVWNRKLNLGRQKELDRLREDGFEIAEDKRQYTIKLSLEAVRNVQLYRTLLHEIGHYYHYISTEAAVYDTIIPAEREVFAHHFAEKMRKELEALGIIPFDSISVNPPFSIF